MTHFIPDYPAKGLRICLFKVHCFNGLAGHATWRQRELSAPLRPVIRDYFE